jgi:hypothetical protein
MRPAVALLCGLATLAALPGTSQAQQFTRDAAALASPATWTNGVAVGDYDADGIEDLAFANGFNYFAGGARPQRLYLGDGAGNFTDASSQLNVADFNAQMLAADDVENDGDLDLIYAPAGAYPVTTQRARLLINDGTANFTNESAARLPNTTMSSWCVLPADLDNDGDRELLFNDGCQSFSGQAGQLKMFENDGSGVYTDVTSTRLPAELYNGQDIICFDYDGDFDLDIAHSGFGTAAKRSILYLNDGNGFFSPDSTLDFLCSSQSYEVDWSDLDGDGDWDAAVQSVTEASVEGWGENRGLGVPPPETTFSGANGNDDNEMASMDYDMDGDMDVFVGSLSANTEKVYQQDASGVFTRVNVFQNISDSTLDFSFGDFDDDGRHDVVTAQGESGVQINKIYDNSGPVDVFAPKFLQVEGPLGVSVGETVFRVMLQDEWVDDGLTNAVAHFDWETFVGGASEASGSGTAGFMGGAMYRAVVPTTVATEGIVLTWNAVDDQGNAAAPLDIAAGDLGADVWEDVGLGLAGTGGLTPSLQGEGPLTPGSGNLVTLTDGLAGSSAGLVIGFSRIDAAFKGGVLVPSADELILGIPVSGAGTIAIPFNWPTGIPGDIDTWLQMWVTDPGATKGFAASNGLRATSQD